MQFKIHNPIDEGWFADPEARFYEGKYMIYATKSLPYEQQQNQVCWTSENLTDWERHDDIIDMSGFPWITRAVWAPTIIEKDGKYYMMWSSGCWTTGTYRVNTACADTPYGPFEDYNVILSTGDSEIANGPGHNGYFYIPEEDLYLIVYHRHHPEVSDGNARFICIDVMRFDENGKILPVTMTKDWEYKDGSIY